jgi:fatty acid synthase subunit alpha
MAAGSSAQPSVNLDKVHETISNLYRLVKSQPQVSKQHMAAIKSLYGEVVKSMGKRSGAAAGTDMPSGRAPTRARRPSNQFLRPVNVPEPTAVPEDKMPLLHLKRKVGNDWAYSTKLTSLYLDILKEIATSGTTFEHKNALLTGVGKASIGVEIVKGLLSGGAKVVITTSRYSRETVEYYQGIYQECGSRGSSLTVVPFNGGSKQDIDALVDYIYSADPNNGLDMDLDFILPFAAIPENGREIDGIDDKSELAHRVMLTNLLRLLGAVKAKKASRRFITRPTQVILPLSPNHGLFGNDGLYSESKISLETLFNRWGSESWGQYLCIAGAVIGWT